MWSILESPPDFWMDFLQITAKRDEGFELNQPSDLNFSPDP